MSDIQLTKNDIERAIVDSQGDLLKKMDEQDEHFLKVKEELEIAKSNSAEAKSENEALTKQYMELADRCMELEQREEEITKEADESLGAMVTLPEITFDVVLVWLVGYSFCSWTELEPDELSRFFRLGPRLRDHHGDLISHVPDLVRDEGRVGRLDHG